MSLGLKGTNVLITGGLGFVGSNLAHRCVELGARVTVYDCLDPHSGGNLYNVHSIKNDVEFCFSDILDFDQISRHVVGKDVIFNCAASTSHPFSMREPWIDLDVNSRGVINLLEAVRRFNAETRLIHLGTSTQLGRLRYRPADEEHPEFPTDIYSANKCVSEKYVLIYASAYGTRATAVRLANIYGPRASIHSPEFTFNNYFIGLALQDRQIPVFGDGRQLRNVLFIDDAVSGLLQISQTEGLIGETVFAVGDEHLSVAEIAQSIVRCLGKGSVRFVEWPAGRKSTDIGDAVISNAKMKERCGWAPKQQFQAGLALTGEYYSACLEKYLT